ncbi:efflux RND transporter periplasmic adaptor subunit [Photobacterium alginatilyticum]|uniref:Efflux RND transporter periplasmic adaptor subunit n=1 Tax=Photobacterium alginatilyticum TaxID=1775171 RepID=A0ABW9YGN6_9GAMM|nr:efflux RND transporter periplasmic adaptor subunit [Photobacterium alginatilyticum]NBI52962.1 efflux RND transporter periplasmic adaptor subunit [Photobacterium alginatilyticum]
MAKRVILTIVGLMVIIGVLAGIKVLQIQRMINNEAAFAVPPETVTTANVRAESWDTLLTAVGSLEAIQGVTVSAELPGKVVQVAFNSGAKAEKGSLLVRQNTASERALLAGAEASVELAQLSFNRNADLYRQKLVSKSELDTARANLRQTVAEADNIRSVIAKKTIRAPFAGRLGIRQVDLGQILSEGEGIVSLQAFGTILVNFLLPQREIARITTGTTIEVSTDALPGTVIKGKITAINPEVDSATRNFQIQATVPNPEEQLRPGMFVNVRVLLSARTTVLTIPSTAVLYAPYSDSAFVVESKEENGESGKVLRQQFIRLGEKRGDYVAVLSGLQEGEVVVSSGVFKLSNGQAVVIDNTLSPDFKLAPEPGNN